MRKITGCFALVATVVRRNWNDEFGIVFVCQCCWRVVSWIGWGILNWLSFYLSRWPLEVCYLAGGSVCGASGQVFGDGLGVSGKDELGSDFVERRQNEEASMRPRMGEGELGRVFNKVVEGDDVNVQRPGFVGLSFWTAAKSSLNGLASGKEGLRLDFVRKDQL